VKLDQEVIRSSRTAVTQPLEPALAYPGDPREPHSHSVVPIHQSRRGYPEPPRFGPSPPRWNGYPPQPPSAAEREKAGLFRAGKVALWVWIAVTLAPILLIGLCLLGCFTGMFGLVGSVATSTSDPP
jgi:hypothetical protein